MVGRDAEQSGIIREGAKLVNVVSNCVVPKITVIVGGSFGAGNYALCGKAFDPRFIFAWPTAQYAVMGGNQAAGTLLDIQVQALKRAGKEPDAEELRTHPRDGEEQLQRANGHPLRSGARWVDAIILPHATREVLLTALRLVMRKPIQTDFKTGVLQV